jgi:hypothetical protein
MWWLGSVEPTSRSQALNQALTRAPVAAICSRRPGLFADSTSRAHRHSVNARSSEVPARTNVARTRPSSAGVVGTTVIACSSKFCRSRSANRSTIAANSASRVGK